MAQHSGSLASYSRSAPCSCVPIRCLFLTFLFVQGVSAALGEAITRQPLEPGVYAAVRGGRTVYLECSPPQGDGAKAFFAKYLANPDEWGVYRNRIAVAVSYERLNAATRRATLLALFPDDYVDSYGWWHAVMFEGALAQEDWRALALWFTNDTSNACVLERNEQNKDVSTPLRKGQVVLIPRQLLPEAFQAPTPKPPPPLIAVRDAAREGGQTQQPESGEQPAPGSPGEGEGETPPLVLPEDLLFETDAQGQHAVYRIKRGEALYTSVVVRFTDFRDHADILEACRCIQKRSGIRDVCDIAAGQKIRIPIEMLSDRFYPQGSAQREAYEATRAEATRLQQNRVHSKDLEGIVIVLDPGHGGRDYGAAVHSAGLFEDELAYDITCRLKAMLETTTRAKVYITVRDRSAGFTCVGQKEFQHDTDEELLTTPPYPNDDAKISANLRWYLANAFYRKERAAGVDDRKFVFVSIHCDMLFNEQLRGAMIYIPGAAHRRDSEQPDGSIYDNYEEARDYRRVTTTAESRRHDEALSLNLAETMLASLRGHNPPLKVHSASTPIRSVIRQSGGRAYLPAVLRNAGIPTKVLVEVANMNNATDRQRLADPQWRQWFAEALLDALKRYFDSA